jgi:hypothetical protein
MRRPPQLGQNPRPLQLNPTTVVSPHCSQRTRRKPRSRMPHRRYDSSSRRTKPGHPPVLSLATTASDSVRDDSSLERSEVAFSEPKVVGLDLPRHRHAQELGGLEVYGQFDAVGALDGHVGRSRAPEDTSLPARRPGPPGRSSQARRTPVRRGRPRAQW